MSGVEVWGPFSNTADCARLHTTLVTKGDAGVLAIRYLLLQPRARNAIVAISIGQDVAPCLALQISRKSKYQSRY